MKTKIQRRIVKKYFIHWRSSVLVACFVCLYSVLLWHVYTIQIEKGNFYSAKAESQIRSLGFLNARRGNIFFQDKNKTRIQATATKDKPFLYAVPAEIEDPESAAIQVAETIPSL